MFEFCLDGCTCGFGQQLQEEVVQMLLEAGADKDMINHDGTTALHLASEHGHEEVVQMLLEAGADKDKGFAGSFSVLS